MKVLQIINSLKTGGAEKLLVESLPLYNKAGVKMDLLLLDATATPFSRQLEAQGCTIITLRSGSVYDPRLVFQIIPYLKKYDLIHVHLFPALYWTALAHLFSQSKVPMVYTEHSTHNKRRGHWLLEHTDRWLYKRYRKLVCISEEVRDALQQHLNTDASMFSVIPNGVDLSAVKAAKPLDRAELGIAKDDFAIVQVASFRKPKDQDTLIRSMRQLPQNVVLMLVGEGTRKSDCETLAAQMGVAARVRFLGERAHVNSILQAADAIVLSSAYEGVSLSAIEGMASGKPFLATDVPGLSTMCKGAALMFALGDATGFASAVTQLMASESKRAEVVQKCGERAAQYDISNMIDAHLRLYRQLL